MASYAPLFANTEAWQWTPDLIWVDSLRVVPTPSYHVQKLFSLNRGDRVLPAALATVRPEDTRLYASSVLEASTGTVIVKLVNAEPRVSDLSVQLQGVRGVGKGTLTVLSSESPGAVNSFADPEKVSPRASEFSPSGPTFDVALPANSFVVIRVSVQQ
jgi:alpha-N-arabinofuranosidase